MIARHIEDTPCCARCKSIPPICAMKHRCRCHYESFTKARVVLKLATATASRQDHWEAAAP